MNRKLVLGALFAAAVLLVLGVACSRTGASEPPAAPALPGGAGIVTGAQGQALAKAGARVVDVRTPGEFAEGHVPGAVNVPFDELERRAAELGAKDSTLLLYCRTGRRSGIASETLRRLGFTKVYDMQRATDWPGELAR